MALVAEAGRVCDLGERQLTAAQQGRRGLNAVSPSRLDQPFAADLAIGARQPCWVQVEPPSDVMRGDWLSR